MSGHFWSNIRPRGIFAALTLSSIEVFLAVLSLLAGLPIVVSGGALAPSSLVGLLDLWQVMMWGFALTAGGSFMLLGIAVREPRLERAGAVLIGVGAGVLAIILAVTGASLLGVMTYGMFSWAMGARFWALGRYLKQVHILKETLHHPHKRMKRRLYFRGQ